MKEKFVETLDLPEGVTATLVGKTLTVKGSAGEVSRSFNHPRVVVGVEGNVISLTAQKATKREKKLLHSFRAHVRNMLKGVQEPFEYQLKICSGHFPMNVSVSGNDFVVKNYLGESVPRKASLLPNCKVKVDGDKVVVESVSKETAGQMAARIESLCTVTNRDRRIFQDGIYIINKAGKEIS